MEGIRRTPVIFQKVVDAVADLRITVVGEEIYPAVADMRQAAYPLDFGFNSDLKWEAHILPPAIADSLRLLMRRLSLEYGAIDMRLTPEGQYVFLEINPSGQVMSIEMETGLKIAQAVAARLASGSKDKSHRCDVKHLDVR